MNYSVFHIKLFIGFLFALTDSCKQIKNEGDQFVTKNDINVEVSEKEEKANFIFPDETNNKCLSWHIGIEPLHDTKSRMMQKIFKLARRSGFQDNECIVCLSLCITMI